MDAVSISSGTGTPTPTPPPTTTPPTTGELQHKVISDTHVPWCYRRTAERSHLMVVKTVDKTVDKTGGKTVDETVDKPGIGSVSASKQTKTTDT